MVKVVCVNCKDIGYTASPNYVRCQCGGELIIVVRTMTLADREVVDLLNKKVIPESYIPSVTRFDGYNMN